MFSSHTFLTSLSAVMLVGVCFVGLRGRGGMCFPVVPRDGSTQTNKGFWFVLLCLKFNDFKSCFTFECNGS